MAAKTDAPTVSTDVAEFLLGVVLSIPMNAGRDDFDQLLPLVLKSREELQAIVSLAQSDAEEQPPNRAARRARKT